MNMESSCFRGVKNNMRRRSVALHVDEGNSLDNSAIPIFANLTCAAASRRTQGLDLARTLSVDP